MSQSEPKISQYQRVVDAVKADIKTGVLKPEDRLPPIATLCVKYGVSNNTICAALRCLSDEGYVKSRRGSGVYVQERKPQKTTGGTSKRDNTLAMILACSSSYEALPFEGAMVKGVIDQGLKEDYHIIVTDSQKVLNTEKELIRKLSSEVAGLIIMPTAEGINYDAYRELREQQIPFVFIDRAVAGIAAPSVTSDNRQVGYLATRHLIESGCRRICAIGTEHSLACQERLNGYLRALEESNLPFDPALMHHIVPSQAETEAILRENVESIRKHAVGGKPEPLGVFAVNEYIANQCYQASTALELKIPHDVSVVGVDDVFAAFFQPQLSTIRQEPYKMGAYTVQLLVEMLTTRELDATPQIRLQPELIVRDSTISASTRPLSPRHPNASTNFAVPVRDPLAL